MSRKQCLECTAVFGGCCMPVFIGLFITFFADSGFKHGLYYVDSCSVDGLVSDCCSSVSIKTDNVLVKGCLIPDDCPFDGGRTFSEICNNVTANCEDALSYEFSISAKRVVDKIATVETYRGFKKCNRPLKAENVRPDSKASICFDQVFYHSRNASIAFFVSFGVSGAFSVLTCVLIVFVL